uniref:Rho-GAP domain-containing protein n=1 Tax=Ditylenchus dipsaci TaxID=166011 RepID=A0A915E7I6_9BILA
MEGIYRVPGNQSQVAELEKAFRKSDKVDLEALNIPVHATATALKKFLDVLPEPLIPVSSHEAILASLELPVQSPTYMDDSPASTTSAVDQHTERIKRLQQVVGEVVPPLNRHVLRHLAQHLKKVAASSSTNSMDFRNLAKVWGPTLFRPNFDSFEMMASSLARFELAAYVMLSNCDSIFLPCLV